MATLWHHRQTVPNPSRRCHSRRRCHRCYVTSWWTVQLRRRYRTISPSKIIIGPLRRKDAAVASTRVQGWGDEPCEPTVRLPDWSELVASYSRMKSASGWANGRQPIFVCYIRKYVIILGGYSRWRPPQPKYWGMCPRHPRRGWRQWEMDTSWVHQWVGLHWVGSDWVEHFGNCRGLSWV